MDASARIESVPAGEEVQAVLTAELLGDSLLRLELRHEGGLVDVVFFDTQFLELIAEDKSETVLEPETPEQGEVLQVENPMNRIIMIVGGVILLSLLLVAGAFIMRRK